MSLSVNYSFEGAGNWSLDGTSGTGSTDENRPAISVDVPEGSEVEAAFLYATTYLNGSSDQVTLSSGEAFTTVTSFEALGLTGPANLQAYRADVTAFVSGVVDDGDADLFSFYAYDIMGANIDGYMLAVVYSNPEEQFRTITFLDGFSDSDGDDFSVTFEEPVDTDLPGFEALLSLGIGFGSQFGSDYEQSSQVTINDRLLTAIAGGQDDGPAGLITVGGVGDNSANPNPSAQSSGPHGDDDELYDLAQGNAANATPFLQDGATTILIETLNPSDDDNIFFAGLNITAEASVSTPENSPPTANPDTDSIGENAAGSYDVVANDTDPNPGDTLTVASIDGVTVSSDNDQVDGIGIAGFFNFDGGSISYDFSGEDTVFDPLAAGETATVTVSYTVQDGNGGTDSSTLTLTVNGVNDAPEANDDFFGYPPSEELGGVVEDPQSGHAYYLNENALTWDGALSEAEALGGHLVTLTTFAENTFVYENVIEPIEGEPGGLWQAWIAASDAEEEGEWRWVAGPEAGFLFWQGNGGGTPFGFDNWALGQPDDFESDEDYAEFWPGGSWNDARGDEEDLRYSIVEFSPPNEDSVTAISENFILDNDSDPDGPDLNLVSVDNSEHGADVWFDEETRTVFYDPANSENIQGLSLGEYVEDTFQYEVSDGELSDFGTVTLRVWGRNDAPVIDLAGGEFEEETALLAVEASETLDYNEGDPPTNIAPDATVSDLDTEDFSGGSLTVSFSANGTEDDILAIENQGEGDGEIGVDGNQIYYQGWFIGTADEPGGSLVVEFDDAGSEGVSVDAVQALIRAVVFSNESDDPSTDPRTVLFTLVDGDGTEYGGSDTGEAAATINVIAENDAPVASIAPASYSTTEQVALSLKNNGLSVADVDAGDGVVVATLSTAQGQLFVTPGSSGAAVGGSGTHIVTITGTLAEINALLNTDASSTVSYINNSDTPAPAAGLTLSVNDQGNSGAGGAKTGSDTVMVNVAAVNDAPVVIAPASYTATEQVALSLKNNGLAVFDADAGNAVVNATLSTSQGQLFVNPGTSGAAVGGSGTHIVTITGTLAQINALLNTDPTSTVSYINNSDTPAPAAGLTLSVNDQGNSGSGGGKTGSDTVMVNIAAVNDAPVAAIAPESYSTTEQVALSLKNNGLSVADVDAGSGVVVATLTTAQGQIFVTPGSSGAAVGGSGTHIVTITGTLAQINALLNTDPTSTVSYINNSDNPAPAAGLTLSVNDQGNSGSGGAKIGSDTVMVHVAAVNDAPVAAIAPASYAATEGVALSLKNNGLSVSDVDAGNAVVIATLSTSQGQLFVTPGTSGAAVGGSGTHIVTITGTLAQINALLNSNATSTVSYVNNSDTPAAAAGLTLSVNDQGNSGSGGAKLGSDNAVINVAAVNDAPVASIAPASYAATEQVALSLKNNGLSVSDVDGGNAVVIATLSTSQGQLFVAPGTSGAAVTGSGTHIVTITGTLAQINALLNSNATSTVSYINNSNNPAPAAGLTLSVNDQGNSGSGGAKIGSDNAVINVAAVNDAPVAAPDAARVNEGASVSGNVIAGAAGGAGRDSDVDGTSLSTKGVVFWKEGGGSAAPGAALNGQFGTLVLQANGSFTYTANPNSSALVAGETGIDRFVYTLVDAGGATSTATLTVSVTGQNLVISNGSGDLFGQRGDDNITGDGGVNRIRGLEGNDRLDGAGGNDQLWGDQGNDQMFGGTGNDDLDGGDGDDTLRLGADNDRGWGGIGNDSIFGEAGDDTIQGDDGNDLLDGGDGNDTVYGEAGDDTILLGIGNDIGDGGTGNDVINGGDGVDQITAGAGNDTLRGDAGNDLMWGDDGNDIFFGGTGDDQYAGGAGIDTLNFDVGVDTGWGGADNDVFTFVRGQAANDVVQDFFGNGAAAGDSFVFQGYGTAAQGATFTQVDATHWQIHSADGLVNEVITLANGAGVHASDFSFI